ncbi:MAG TPA: formimidoylglutamate deiminase [Steroidobacteraceae bacterium]|nr:formimidoylglutamate deiminase [Steroidobacteraceae bacterium]
MASLWFRSALLSSGWAEGVRVQVSAGRIAGLELGARPAAEDERHAVALPGLANVHSHAFQRAMAGLTEIAGPLAEDFWTWREVMYRFVDRLSPDDVEAIAAWAYLEMLEAGFTRVAEFHYLHHDPAGRPYARPAEMAARIVAAAESTGIGLTLLPVLYAHADFGELPPERAQRRFLSSLEQYARILEDCRALCSGLAEAVVGVAPHSLRAVSPAQLDAIVQLGANGPVHIHIAEQTREVEACLEWCRQRPVEWLIDHASVDANWCLVHALHMSETETRRVAESGAVVGVCPITEADLGDGILPTPLLLQCGGSIGVGTDSNVLIDAAAELRALEYAQRLALRRRNVLAGAQGASTGRTLYAAAVKGGAQASAGGGELALGRPADLISLNTDHPALSGRRDDALIDSLIFATRGQAIDCVWRGGVKVVAGGVHREHARLEARYRAVTARLN